MHQPLEAITLALHNYHDANGQFPTSKFGTGECHNWVSFHVTMLPYAEQNAKYDYLTGVNAFSWIGSAQNNPKVNASDTAGIYSGSIPYLACPSDGRAKEPFAERNNATRTNYMGSFGDTLYGADESTPNDRGFFTGPMYHATRPLVPRYRTFGSITDGTSNTIAFSEAVTGQYGSRDVKGGVVLGISHIPSNVLKKVSTTDRNVYANGETVADYARGMSYAEGNVTITGFQTILPPNSPSGHSYAGGLDQCGWFYSISSASSNHTGGVNVGRVDGSVSFVSSTVDSGDPDADVYGTKYPTKIYDGLPEFTGRSPFGVWGALGTIAGGESTSL